MPSLKVEVYFTPTLYGIESPSPGFIPTVVFDPVKLNVLLTIIALLGTIPVTG